MTYQLDYTETFVKSIKKLSGKKPLDIKLKKALEKCLITLADNPKSPGLNSHIVDSLDKKDVWSSWVTGDIRIIWEYNENKTLSIFLIRVGGHSGRNSVYK